MCDWFPIKKHAFGLHRDLSIELYSIGSMPVCDKQALVECGLYRQKHWETRQSIKLLSGDVFCHSVCLPRLFELHEALPLLLSP